jgi:type IV pilus assembly protein PilA
MIKVHRNSKGFTLIELLIVIAIIGILAAIAIPAYTGYTKKSKVAGVVHAMGGIKTALAAYFTEKGSGTTGAATATDINTILGVSVPTQYISDCAVADGAAGAITCTLTNIGSGVNGLVITLTPDAAYKTWTWAGTVDSTYIPKN